MTRRFSRHAPKVWRRRLTLETLERRDVPSFVAAPIYDSVLTYYIAAGELTGDGSDDAVIGHEIGKNVEILHGNGDGTFAGGRTYYVSDLIHGLIVADVSGDGNLDVITNHLHTDKIRVLAGNGDGTFQNPIAYAAGDWPGTPAAGDFDHDGDLDLAVPAEENNNGLVNVLINAGGVFEPPVPYQDDSLYRLKDIETVDLNADGNLDLAALDTFGDILILLGNGDGTFAVSKKNNSGVGLPQVMTSGDWDGDGDTDLAIGASGSVKLAWGNGDGTFAPQLGSIPVAAHADDIIAVDVDGDGDLDLFLADEDEVFILRNQGGAFRRQQRYSGLAIDVDVGDFNNDQNIDFVAAGVEVVTTFLNVGGGLMAAPNFAGRGRITPTDLNGDGDIDLALTSQSSILTGSGGVQFKGGAKIPTSNLFFGSGDATAIETPDLDGDGDFDAVVQLSHSGPYQLGLWKNNGNATFPVDSPSYGLCTNTSPEFGTVGDINNDGNLDMIVAGGTVCSFRGNGDGTLQNPTTQLSGSTFIGVVTAFVNADDFLDLLVTNSLDNGTVIYLQGLGNGGFTFGGSFAVGAKPIGLRVADFDDDGDTDVVVANSGSGNISLLLGNNDGTFAPAIHSAVGGNGPRNLAIGDFNIDGRLDLAVANILSHNACILFGNGDGTFSPPTIYGTSLSPKDVEVADLNGDGFEDLAVSSDAVAAVDLLFGNGDGTFAPATVLSAPSQGYNLDIADFDLDGIFDIIVAFPFASVGLFRGNGDGTFKFVDPYVAGSSPVDVVAADMNNDGRLDLAVTNILNPSVRVVLNSPTGFAATQLVSIVKPAAMQFADFDGDGDIDMATSASDGLRVRLNEGNGTFEPFVYYPVASAGPLLVADFNQDGNPDLALGHKPDAGNNTVTVWLGNGDGTFLAAADFAAGFTPDELLMGDFNGDSVPDIGATQGAANVTVAFGNGDGTFTVAPGTSVVGGNDIVSGDFNSDGKTDLATTQEFESHIHFLHVLLGTGNGTFLPAISYIFASYYTNDPTWLATGDFDRDGWLDLAVSGEKIGIFRNAADWAPLPIGDGPSARGGFAPLDVSRAEEKLQPAATEWLTSNHSTMKPVDESPIEIPARPKYAARHVIRVSLGETTERALDLVSTDI